MTPEVTVYKVLHKLVATTSLCIPGVNLRKEWKLVSHYPSAIIPQGKDSDMFHTVSGEVPVGNVQVHAVVIRL